MLVEAARARAQHGDGCAALAGAFGDPLVSDAVLFKGAALAAFLDTRGFLLPADEHWWPSGGLLVSRSVHEVLDVSPGWTCTLRDVRSGEVRRVRERTAGAQLNAGEFYCTRVLLAGETMRVVAGMQLV